MGFPEILSKTNRYPDFVIWAKALTFFSFICISIRFGAAGKSLSQIS